VNGAANMCGPTMAWPASWSAGKRCIGRCLFGKGCRSDHRCHDP